jgi:hypothetical protein
MHKQPDAAAQKSAASGNHAAMDPGAVRWSFVDDMVSSVPSWGTIWREHQSAHPTQAPESFLRTVAYLSPTRIGADRHFHDLDAEAAFVFLERAFGVDPTIDSMIAISFLANILQIEMFSTEATSLLGVKLRAELERHRAGNGIPVPTPYSDFVNDLAARQEAVAEVLREHVDGWDDELLPHLFMDDLVRAAIVWLSTDDARSSVVSMLASLEDAYGHDYEIDELIATGFVENLPYPDDEGAELLGMLGPKLRAEYNAERPSHRI